MKSHNYSKFTEGMDERYIETSRKPNGITSLTNCFVSNQNRIKKRPGVEHKGSFRDLPPIYLGLTNNNRGLFSFNGKLWTVSGSDANGPVGSSGDAAVWTIKIHDAWAVTQFYSAWPFLGGIYLSIRNGSTNTHWYVIPDLPVWEPDTVYAVGDRVQPTTGTDTLNRVVYQQFYYEVTAVAGDEKSHATTEPVWPTDSTPVVDDQVTWIAVHTRILDTNCPNTPAVIAHKTKIYAVGSVDNEGVDEHDIVRFSATGDPRDWTTADDAGFLPTGNQSTGSETPTALGRYGDKLVVFMDDTTEIWAVDEDPALNALLQVIGGNGTTAFRSLTPIGTDLVFLAPEGFRSIGQQAYTVNLEDLDIGSPVDVAVQGSVKNTTIAPHSMAFPAAGQYWCCMNADIWVWTWSRNSNVKAWAKFRSPNGLTDLAYLNGVMYARAGNHSLLAFNPDAFVDYNGSFPVTTEFAFQSNNLVGTLKQYTGADILMKGRADITFKTDPNNPDIETAPIELIGNTRPGVMNPVECVTTEIAPVLRYTGIDDFRLDSLTLYFEPLGMV